MNKGSHFQRDNVHGQLINLLDKSCPPNQSEKVANGKVKHLIAASADNVRASDRSILARKRINFLKRESFSSSFGIHDAPAQYSI